MSTKIFGIIWVTVTTEIVVPKPGAHPEHRCPFELQLCFNSCLCK